MLAVHLSRAVPIAFPAQQLASTLDLLARIIMRSLHRCILIALTIPSLLSAQKPDTKAEEAAWQARVRAAFLPKDFKRTYPDVAANRVPSVAALARLLEGEFRSKPGYEAFDEPVASDMLFNKQFSYLTEDGSRRHYIVSAAAYPSLREAEDGFARYIGMTQLKGKMGSLPGTNIGEAAHHYPPFKIVFLRRNVFVAVHLQRLENDPASGRTKSTTPPSLEAECVKLATLLDDFLLTKQP